MPDQILINQLLRIRNQIQNYGDQHMAKTPPQVAKAAANYAAVSDINRALLKYLEAKASGDLTPSS